MCTLRSIEEFLLDPGLKISYSFHMAKIFKNRREAGQLLAQKLSHLRNRSDVMVLALPRGGVPVGYEVAQSLNVPLDIILVRKLGVPMQEELAMGAIAFGGTTVFNEEIIRSFMIPEEEIQQVIAEEQQVLNERNIKYRNNRPFPDLKNKTIILVDDGIATGATMRAAIKALRKLGTSNIIVAAPVAPPEVFLEFKTLVDQIICLETPPLFSAIGMWYDDFTQTSDEEVIKLLNG